MNPFKLTGPTTIGFSGGRTSAMMVYKVLEANTTGDVDQWLRVLFANTGKESEETLVFVNEVSQQWSIPITWVEYIAEEPRYRVVDFKTASRNGEPFEALITKRQYLPSPVSRFCTTDMKIMAIRRYMKTQWEEWDHCIGIRADEPRRVAKMKAQTDPDENIRMPLAEAGITVVDVRNFWKEQLFDLGLPVYNGQTYGGNCDLCFMKGLQQRVRLIQEKPERAVWWVKMEEKIGFRFRKSERGYASLVEMAKLPSNPFGFGDEEDDSIDCFCGD